jgi:hypothetical protein
MRRIRHSEKCQAGITAKLFTCLACPTENPLDMSAQWAQTRDLGGHGCDLATRGHCQFNFCLQPIIQIMSVLSSPLLK